MEKQKVEKVLEQKIMSTMERLTYYLKLKEMEDENGNPNPSITAMYKKHVYAERKVIGAYLNVASSLDIISYDEWNHCIDTIHGDNAIDCHLEKEECIIRKECKGVK